MLRALRVLISLYFSTWWLPLMCFALSAGLFVLCLLPLGNIIRAAADAAFIFTAASFFGIFIASIYAFTKRAWIRGSALFLSLILLFIVIGAAIFLSIARMFGGPSEDGFANDLTIPGNIQISTPPDIDSGKGPESPDAFQLAILKAIDGKGSNDTTVQAELPALAKLLKENPDILRRYLATSIAWRMFQERALTFATRRWVINGRWSFELHGYYSSHELERWSGGHVPSFQTRLTLGLSGKPWAGILSKKTFLKPGKSVSVQVDPEDNNKSLCILPIEGVTIEIFEESEAAERRITTATLAFLENELAPLSANPTWETIQKIVPPGSIIEGEPGLDLRGQEGNYDTEIRVNPGEPGRIYLRAYEITKGTRLSEDRLGESSNEYIGWSDNPRQQFYSNTTITIYEGDREQPYAARFEVWFIPDSGKPERKLLEKNFKSEGWER